MPEVMWERIEALAGELALQAKQRLAEAMTEAGEDANESTLWKLRRTQLRYALSSRLSPGQTP